MPIPLPNLDDRRWAELVADGLSQIPRYAPQWTDHNAHDPGITLIELFAWLAEMTDYRLNRVPPRHKRKFLDLLGFDAAGPAPARVLLGFTAPPPAAPFVLPTGAEFEGTSPEQRPVSFRTLRATTVSAAALSAVQTDAGKGAILDRTHDFRDGLPIPVLGAAPAAGAALYLGFDRLVPEIPLALGLRFEGPGNDALERQRILEEAAAEADACIAVTTRIRCAGRVVVNPVPPLPPHHSVRIVWEVFTTTGWTALPATDDTRSLTLNGIVEITPPANIVRTALGGVPSLLFYVRGRMEAGTFDAMPVLLDLVVNAAPAAQAVPVTEKYLIKAGISPAGAAPIPGHAVQLALTVDDRKVIQSLTFGTGSGPIVRVWSYTPPGTSAGEITLDFELAGAGTGLPGQRLNLRGAPLEAASLEVYTVSGAAWQQWSLRKDFDSSTRADFHYLLDATAGVLSFGSGERGRTPPVGCLVLVRYRATAAAGGNLARATVNRPRQSAVNDVLLQPLPAATRSELSQITGHHAPATGGAAAETLEHAFGRAVEVLQAHQRLLDMAARLKTSTLDQVAAPTVRTLVPPSSGVNLLDLECIALSVPGTRLRRARAFASLHPGYPCLNAPGLVTVVVVPEYPPGMPLPSPGLLERVWRYLNRRRMICTSLHVVGPQYSEVTVTASVRGRPGASPPKLVERIKAALNLFLDPLAGGPDSLGWPFGRTVYRSEILQLIQSVPGVDYVASMSMQSGGAGAACGDLPLCPMSLTCAGAHQIEAL